jgi:hypothetical protein
VEDGELVEDGGEVDIVLEVAAGDEVDVGPTFIVARD